MFYSARLQLQVVIHSRVAQFRVYSATLLTPIIMVIVCTDEAVCAYMYMYMEHIQQKVCQAHTKVYSFSLQSSP